MRVELTSGNLLSVCVPPSTTPKTLPSVLLLILLILADPDHVQDLQQVMVSGPNLNETSIVSGGYGGAAEGIIPTSSVKGKVLLFQRKSVTLTPDRHVSESVSNSVRTCCELQRRL